MGYVVVFLVIGLAVLIVCAGFVGAGITVRALKRADSTRSTSDQYHRKFMRDGWLTFSQLIRAFHDRDGVGIRQAESRFGLMNPVQPPEKPVKSHRPGVPQPPPAATGIRPATYGTPRRG